MEEEYSAWPKVYRDKLGRIKFELADGQALPQGIEKTGLLARVRAAVEAGRIIPIEVDSVFDQPA